MTKNCERLRFYGRRSGHKVKKGRQQLMDRLLPSLSVTLPTDTQSIDPASLFDEPKRELWFEIGFGGGEHLATQAAANPDIGFIGCEPFVNGVASLLGHVEEHGLTNVRIYGDDARDVLDRLPNGSVSRLFILFPDPWPKSKHHKRRFLSPSNMDLLADVLADGAELRFGSDHDGYVSWALEHLLNDGRFEWLAEKPSDWRTRPSDWPETRYEAKAAAKGITSVYLRFRRIPR